MAGDLADYCRQFEAMCLKFQSPATFEESNKFLEAFREAPMALAVARMVLEGSEADIAQFQAALLIRDVVLRTWAIRSPQERLELRAAMLSLAFDRWSRLASVVQGQVLQTVAVMWKRGWLEESAESQQTMLGQVHALLQSSDVQHQLLGMKLFHALMDEFVESKAVPVGLAVEFHRRCRNVFQATTLRHVFMEAFELCRPLAGATPLTSEDGTAAGVLDSTRLAVLDTAFTIMSDCLGWDFDGSNQASQTLEPGPDWTTIFCSSDFITTLFAAYNAVRGLYATPLPHLVRQLIVQCCSVRGDVFPNPAAEIAYVGNILPTVLRLASSGVEVTVEMMIANSSRAASLAEAVGAETTAFSEAISRIIVAHSFEVLTGLGAHMFADSIAQISAFSKRLLDRAAAAATYHASLRSSAYASSAEAPVVEEFLDSERSWNLESFELLLQSWVRLTMCAMSLEDTSGVAIVIVHAATQLFQTLVNQRLAIASAIVSAGVDENDEFEDTSKLRDHLEAAALLGRVQAEVSVPFLANRMTMAGTTLVEQVAAGCSEQEWSVTCEQLFWLLSYAGNLLADWEEGDTPLVPTELNDLSKGTAHRAGVSKLGAGAAVDQDPVVQLSTCCLNVLDVLAAAAADAGKAILVSPLLAARCCWFVNLWARTYLMVDLSHYRTTAISPTLTVSFSSVGPDARGSQLMDKLIINVATLLAVLADQPDVVEEALSALGALTSSKTAASVAVNSAQWLHLCSAACRMIAGKEAMIESMAELGPLVYLCGLPDDAQLELISILVGAARVLDPVHSQGQYLNALGTAVRDRMQAVLATGVFALNNGTFGDAAQNPKVTAEMHRLLSICEGVFCIESVPDAAWMLPAAIPVLQACKALIDGYHARTVVTVACLEFAYAFVRSQLQRFKPPDAGTVYQLCSDVLATYVRHKEGWVCKARSDTDAEFEELVALLRLLVYMIIDDKVLGGADCPVHVADVVLFCLKLVLPLVTREMLQFPLVCSIFLQIITNAMSHYPQQVAALDGPQCDALLSALEFGIMHLDVDTRRSSIETLQSLLTFHLTTHGWREQLTRTPNAFTRFFQPLLSTILAPSCPAPLLPPISAALFLLISCEPDAFRHYMSSIRDSQPTEDNRLRFEAAHQGLFSNGVTAEITRINRLKFQNNLSQFVTSVQPFVTFK